MASRHAKVLLVGVVCGLSLLTGRIAYAQSARDPCALLTQPQVSSAVGAMVGAGQPIGTTGCQWSTQDETHAKSGKMVVTLSLLDERAFPKSAPSPGFALAPVSGIGDDAVFTTVGPYSSLAVKKGKSVFVVRVYGVPDQPKQQAIEKSLAKDVLAKW
jgi:hypothetical protein